MSIILRQDDLLPMAAYLSIAHHIPGRIRLKLAGDVEKEMGAMVAAVKQLKEALDQSAAVRSVSVNLLARSCTIEYDPKRIPPDAWTDLASGSKSPALDQLVAAIFEPSEDA